eukprot:3337080-Amphidinium_carterae.1
MCNHKAWPQNRKLKGHHPALKGHHSNRGGSPWMIFLDVESSVSGRGHQDSQPFSVESGPNRQERRPRRLSQPNTLRNRAAAVQQRSWRLQLASSLAVSAILSAKDLSFMVRCLAKLT